MNTENEKSALEAVAEEDKKCEDTPKKGSVEHDSKRGKGKKEKKEKEGKKDKVGDKKKRKKNKKAKKP